MIKRIKASFCRVWSDVWPFALCLAPLLTPLLCGVVLLYLAMVGFGIIGEVASK